MPESEPAVPDEISRRLHDPRVIDARRRMVDLAGMDENALGQTVRVMDAMFRWREAEQRVTRASHRYMNLGDTDMRALRLAMVSADQGHHLTAREIAEHLHITSAATTKLLDRLEAAGHITRTRHPTDRRALAILVNPETRRAAEVTIGREHARRFRVAAALQPEERETVIRFLDALSETTEADWEPEASE